MRNVNDQEDRKQVLLNDKSARDGSSLLDQTALVDPDLGGRWTKQENLKPKIVRGSTDYPAPAAPQWSKDTALLEPEPPLGFKIDGGAND